MIDWIIDIPFIRKWFYKLRPKKVYKASEDLFYTFHEDHFGIYYKGMIVRMNAANFVKEAMAHTSMGKGGDYAALTTEERQNLLRYYESQEDFEKCKIIKDVEEKINFLKNGKI
jgi:hypothetical protein